MNLTPFSRVLEVPAQRVCAGRRPADRPHSPEPRRGTALQSAGVDRDVRGWEHSSDHAPAWVKLKETNMLLEDRL